MGPKWGAGCNCDLCARNSGGKRAGELEIRAVD